MAAVRSRTLGWVAAGAAALALLAGCSPAPATSTAAAGSDATAPTSSAVVPGGTTALAALATVPVKGRAPRTGYDRDQFGPAWADTDHNGCDTRNDVLARDLTDETFKSGTHDCVVATGTLADPYSGKTIDFVRGNATSEAVQIDHVVALSDAWQKGAQGWDLARRTAFANDPLNLLAVDGPLNQQKSDGDAATWLPPDSSFRCTYVARQVAVKIAYGLWMTSAEEQAIAGILGGCPDQPLPTEAATAVPSSLPSSPVPSSPVSSSPVPSSPAGGVAPQTVPAPTSDVYYADCAAARAAGAAPLHAGQPGYRDGLDGDHDGTACDS